MIMEIVYSLLSNSNIAEWRAEELSIIENISPSELKNILEIYLNKDINLIQASSSWVPR